MFCKTIVLNDYVFVALFESYLGCDGEKMSEILQDRLQFQNGGGMVCNMENNGMWQQ